MSCFENLRTERDERNVVTVTIDVVSRPVNVFDENLLRELAALVDELAADASIRLVVFHSGKASGFLAGADVHQIHGISNVDEVEAALKGGQDLFQRVADLPFPTIAVIHGPCLGGGLEFALACTHRVARDDSATRIGLPETQLGLIPGWGGTQRLPRLVGVTTAVQMILAGSRLTPSKAKRIGLIDAAFNPESFEKDVAQIINHRLEGRPLNPVLRPWLARLRDGTSIGRRLVLRFARRQIRRQAKYYPALNAALRAVETGLRHGMNAGLAAERKEFSRILFSPSSRNLLDLFLNRERARQRTTWVAEDTGSPAAIRSIAVLGAGTMGAGIAQLAATQGCSVVLKDVNDDAVQQGMERIESLTQQAVKKGAISSSDAESALARITCTTETAPLVNVDLVIEAIVERLDVKQQVFRELDEQLPADTLLASNTSALPISEMAAATNRPDRVGGLHFFNPVHKMPLVEVVRGATTSDETIASLVDVVRRLGKTPIVVAEGPGFLVNRILFPYLDEAVRLVCEGMPVKDVDRDAKRFGLPMGPLELLDTVGLDVAADVSRTLAGHGAEESPTPEKLAQMVSAGHTGRKSGRGFYTWQDGRRGEPAAPTAGSGADCILPPSADLAGETISGIQQRLAFSLINAAADCLHNQIVTEPWMVDLGMVLGTGFAPFRGGPLKLVETWGRDTVFARLEELSQLCGPRFHPSAYFNQTEGSDSTVTDNHSPTSESAEQLSVGCTGE